MICPFESCRERVEVSHVIVECIMINHHPGDVGQQFADFLTPVYKYHNNTSITIQYKAALTTCEHKYYY